jgi:hypothetical protein
VTSSSPASGSITVDIAVRNLVGRYCDEVTTADVDRWAGLWAEDATWAIPGDGVVTGREAIRATFARIRPTYLLCVQEILSGTVDVIDERNARARWYVRELQWSQSDDEVAGSELIGIYDDEVTIDAEGTARFAARSFALLWSGAVPLDGRFHRAAYERSATVRR